MAKNSLFDYNIEPGVETYSGISEWNWIVWPSLAYQSGMVPGKYIPYNVQVFAGAPFPAFIFAFLGTFIPMYILCYVVAMIFIPIAQGAAAKAEAAA